MVQTSILAIGDLHCDQICLLAIRNVVKQKSNKQESINWFEIKNATIASFANVFKTSLKLSRESWAD